MRKIKDLVTVQLEIVFMLFPIDSERYDFADALERILICRESGGLESGWASEDPRVNQAVLDVIATLAISSRALAAVSFRPGANHSDISHERACRCEATIGREAYRLAIQSDTEYEAEAAFTSLMMRMLLVRLWSEHGRKPVH